MLLEYSTIGSAPGFEPGGCRFESCYSNSLGSIMKYSSVEELLAAPDFDTLVIYGVCGKRNGVLDLPISMDDFLQEVRIKVFKCVKPHTLEKLSHTTIIVKCARWTFTYVCRKTKKETRTLTGVDFTTIIDESSSRDAEHADNNEQLELALNNPVVDNYSRNLLVGRYILGKKLKEFAQEENTSKENIRQKINNRLNLVRRHARKCSL